MLNDVLIGWLVNEGVELFKGCPSEQAAQKDVDEIEEIISGSCSSLQRRHRHKTFELGHRHQYGWHKYQKQLQHYSRQEPLDE